MADTGYLEFSYNEAEVNEITSYLTSTKNRLNEYNLSSLISQLQNCRGWSRLGSSSEYISQLNTYKDSGTNYASAIEKERARISDTLAALKAFDGEVVTTETNWWASAGMAFFNFTEGFLTGFEQVLDGLMTGAAVLTGWLGLEGVSNALTSAVEYEIFGEMFDYLFENVEFFKNIEEHAAWAHDDSQADIFKGAGTLTSYIVMAAMGGGALGKGFNVLGKTIKLAGGAWTGPASIVADMVITGVGTLGAETQKELQAQEVNDINAAAWAAMDDVVLSTVIAGGAGAAFEFGPGLIKKGYQGAKAFFSEAAEEGAQAGTKALTGEVVEGGAKNLLGEGAEAGAKNAGEEAAQAGAKNAAGDATQESVQQSVQNVVGDTTQNAASKMQPTDVWDGNLTDDAVKEFMQNGSGEMDVVLFRSQNGSVVGMTQEQFEQQAQEFFEQTGKDLVQEMNERGVDVFSDTMVRNGPGQEGFKSMLGDSADNIVGDSVDNVVGDTVDNIRPNNDVTDLVPVENTPIRPNTDVTDLVPVSAADNIAGDAAGDTALAIVNKEAGQEVGQHIASEAFEETAENAAKKGAGEVFEEAASNGTAIAVRQGGEELAQGLARQGTEEAAEQIAKRGIRETVEEAAQRGASTWGKKAIIHSSDDLLPDSEAVGGGNPPEVCPNCGQNPCVCPTGVGACPVCGQNPCVCPTGGGGCPICGQNPCVCPTGGGGNCPTCGQNPCVCPTGGGGNCPTCGQNPCVCPTDGGKCPTCGQNPCVCPTDDGKCPNCGQNPCVCPNDDEKCPTCGQNPCVCPKDDEKCPNCGQNPCVCPSGGDKCPNCGQNPCVCNPGPGQEWPTGGPGSIIDDITTGEDSEISSLTDKFGDATGLGEIIDLASGVNIPTSPDPIRTKINAKDNKMIPLMAGLGAAALAGLGTKAYLERKENKDEEDEIEADEWEEEDAAELALNTEAYDNELEESDYLLPTDEYAFQPEGAEMSSETELDDEDRYHAVNSSDLPSMN